MDCLNLEQMLCEPKKINYHTVQMEELKRSKRPSFVFGGGGGINTSKLLCENGVNVAGFVESASYYKPGKKILGKPVYSYDDFCEPEKRNLIFAATGKNILQVAENEQKLGNNTYFFDYLGYFYDMSYEWVLEHVVELQDTFDLLEDELSRETFLSFIDYKAKCVKVEVRPLWKLWRCDQYYNDLYNFHGFKMHAMVDCGAWIGDTSMDYLDFLQKAGISGKVYAFEPDPDSFVKLKENAAARGNIECYNYAVGSETKQVIFSAGGSGASHLSQNGEGVEVSMVRADDIILDKPTSMIKMDLEGSEVDALCGLKSTISKNAPNLAVCVYHKIDDLIKIPQYIRSLVQDTGIEYKYYLRHHSTTLVETVFYGIPQK